MPTKIRISKEMILDAEFEIVRKDGMENKICQSCGMPIHCEKLFPTLKRWKNI